MVFMMTTKQASEIAIGDTVVERDGYLLKVIDVAHHRGRVIIWTESDGPGPRRQSTEVRKSTMVRVFVTEAA